MKLRFKKLREDAILPSYAHKGDAGLDLTTIGFTQEFDKSGKLVLIYHTGVAVEIPEGHVGLIFMRSSIAEKSIMLTNCVGVIDYGYTGELKGKFKVTTDAVPSIYQAGEKFAQLIVIEKPEMEPEWAEDELEAGDRGENGYGSTDKEEANETPEQGRDSGTVEGDPQ